jgi:hypothetical protein
MSNVLPRDKQLTVANHIAMTGLHFGYYNFVKIHSSIRCTPAMAIGIESTAWSMGDLLDAATEASEVSK